MIQPLVVISIKATNRKDLYGVTGYPDYKGRGSKADKYAKFIDTELYAFIRKKTGVRKFNSVAIAGCALGGLSAFDVAFNHADKIDKVGVFSGSFSYSGKSVESPDYNDQTDRIVLNNIQSSRKRPHLKYWMYGDDPDEAGIRYKDSIAINHTKDLIAIIKNKNISSSADITYIESSTDKQDYESWSKVFPGFLIWAFGK